MFFEKCEHEFAKRKQRKGGRSSTDYEITLDMAKEIAMLQRNEKGKRAVKERR